MSPLNFLSYLRDILVGRPVTVVQCDKPTLDQIHEVQKRYIEELFRYVDYFS